MLTVIALELGTRNIRVKFVENNFRDLLKNTIWIVVSFVLLFVLIVFLAWGVEAIQEALRESLCIYGK